MCDAGPMAEGFDDCFGFPLPRGGFADDLRRICLGNLNLAHGQIFANKLSCNVGLVFDRGYYRESPCLWDGIVD